MDRERPPERRQVGIAGLSSSRQSDFLGIAVAYGKVMGPLPTETAVPEAFGAHELGVELSYAARVSPWCVLQPDLQYLHYAVSSDASHPVHSTPIIGLRASLRLW
ncbi:MAG: carbohydrate porin [Steroidobacteraceae bacterium]